MLSARSAGVYDRAVADVDEAPEPPLSDLLRQAADRLDEVQRQAAGDVELSSLEVDLLRVLRATPSGLDQATLAERVWVAERRLADVVAGLEVQQLLRRRPDRSVAVSVMGARLLADHERRVAKIVDDLVDDALGARDHRILVEAARALCRLPL